MLSTAVGIKGIGVYLPDTIRANEFWPPELVQQWRKTTDRGVQEPGGSAQPRTEGERMVGDALTALHNDAFKGAVQRRVAAPGMSSVEMETRAARQALANAGVANDAINLVLTYSAVPDYISANTACSVHENLGLSAKCLTLAVDGACNSFLMQMTIARRMIEAGETEHALLVQSAALSRVLPIEESYSPWFGDGATAVVVGPVRPGRGILGSSHRTDGRLGNTLVIGVPGRRWYEDGRPRLYSANTTAARRVFEATADHGRQVALEALSAAGLCAGDVGFYAAHQASAWFRAVTQQYLGLSHARTVDTYGWAGSLFAANLPLVLATATERGLLQNDDVVLMYTGGTGITYSSLVLRWGAE
jgi:3-oxoacyl-[acyl-carrier-protein] synthase III